jgi:asparagine N-glycosylation enzyme membrane subunit Stt3
MFSFNPFYLLLWIFIANFLPGALLSLGLLKEKKLLLIEKIGFGFALGIIIPPFFLFLFQLTGINYSFATAFAATLIFYAISIAIFYYKKGFEGLGGIKIEASEQRWVFLGIILLVLLAFWIRLQSYGPIFQELDPYYYAYEPYLYLSKGFAPLNDGTAWWPHEVNHRVKPVLSFLEAEWYSFYTWGGKADNYLLSAVCSVYPPIAAALAVFFLYIFLSSEYKREYALLAAFLASFIPIFIIKTMAGEFEIQPYAFFSLSLFFASYALAIKNRDFVFASIAALALIAVYLGSSSIVVAISALIIFIPIHAIHLFMKGESSLLPAGINVLILSALILASILSRTYSSGMFVFDVGGSIGYALFGVVAFMACLLYFEKKYSPDKSKIINYAGIAMAILVVAFFFTPFGGIVKSIASNSLEVAQYTLPLHRTIQEQGLAGSNFYGSLGFLGKTFSEQDILYGFFAIFTSFVNTIYGIGVWVVNTIFESSLVYDDKDVSFLMFFIFLVLVSSAYALYRKFILGEESLIVLFLAIVFPVSLVGIIKAKYTIYMGYFFAMSLAIILGEFERMLSPFFQNKNALFNGLVAFGFLVVLFEGFLDTSSYAGPLLFNSYKVRFQDNPLALQSKMATLCSMGLTEACYAAQDPIGYANQGINKQFDYALCVYSLLSNPQSPSPSEQLAATIRCQRVASYWIDSMEWLRYNTPEGSRIISWWDYGHWENYFALRNAVIRNEHAYYDMITDVAHDFIMDSEPALIQTMKKYGAQYALFDSELILSGGHFGGKFGALNYLACAHANLTDVSKWPGQSLCEFENTWEQIYVSSEECVVSPITGKKGRVAYVITATEGPSGPQTSFKPFYCFSTAKLADGKEIPATYYLERKNEAGELLLNKAFLLYDGKTSAGGYNVYTLLYTKDKVWLENGSVVDGWSDRKGRFYDSNLYKGFVLKELEGFELVYTTPDEAVKIYKIKE